MHELLGRGIYLGVQALRREPVRRALEDLRNSERMSRDELLQLQANRQLAQLRFAQKHVPHYRAVLSPLLNELNNARNWEDVSTIMRQIPVLEKGTLVGNLSDYTADNLSQLKTYPDKTSGSSGTPLTFPCDKSAWAYRHALIFRCMEWFGVKVGEPSALFFGLHWNRRTRMQLVLRDFLLNRVRISAFEVGPQKLEKHLKALIASRPTHILGYPSATSDFCMLLKERQIDLHHLRMKAVFLTAETLNESQRSVIEEVTGARCVNMYGSAEGGGNAFECPHGSLHISVEATWVALKHPETNTGEALVTDMMLRACPLINYAVGDEISIKEGQCTCGRHHPLLEKVEGRSSDAILLSNGRKISPDLPHYIFKPLGARGVIRKYRFVQLPNKELYLFLVVTTKFSSQDLRDVEKGTLAAFGPELSIVTRIVEDLPHLANAKHRDFVQVTDAGAVEPYLKFLFA